MACRKVKVYIYMQNCTVNAIHYPIGSVHLKCKHAAQSALHGGIKMVKIKLSRQKINVKHWECVNI